MVTLKSRFTILPSKCDKGTKLFYYVIHLNFQIIEIDESDAYVRFMKKSGRLYTWPDPEDCAFQPLDNLITKVKAPEVVNERLQYRFTDSDIEKVKSLLKGNTVNFS